MSQLDITVLQLKNALVERHDLKVKYFQCLHAIKYWDEQDKLYWGIMDWHGMGPINPMNKYLADDSKHKLMAFRLQLQSNRNEIKDLIRKIRGGK